MTEDHEQNEHEPVDDVNEIMNQLNSTALEVDQQRTAAVATTHTSDGSLLSHVTQLATTRKNPVTFWSLPREVRDMIWSEVLGSEDDIFQANVITSVCNTESEARGHTRITQAPILLSSQPPLPLAHLCQESRAFALQKYDAAYRKVIGPDLNQERGDRFRWLSRYAARLLSINIDNGDYDEADIKVPLGEDERLILLRHRSEPKWHPWEPTEHRKTNEDNPKLPALLELLKKAKDYQIMICSNIGVPDPSLINRDIAQNWGVFADRAPAEGFAEDRATSWGTRIFVEARDTYHMVQLLRDLNRRGRRVDLRGLGLRTHITCGDTIWRMSRMVLLAPILRRGDLPYLTADGFRRLEEEEIFPYGNFVSAFEDLKWLPKELSLCLEPFEKFWAENVNEKEISSQSRYGRMPKIGLVFEYDIRHTWDDVRREIASGYRK